jgi:hypothetical protein
MLKNRPVVPPLVPGSDEWYDSAEYFRSGVLNPKKVRRVAPAFALRDQFESRIKGLRTQAKRLRQRRLALKEEVSRLEALKFCVVCKSNVRDSLLPCMHFVTCNQCAQNILTCPVVTCRKPCNGYAEEVVFY